SSNSYPRASAGGHGASRNGGRSSLWRYHDAARQLRGVLSPTSWRLAPDLHSSPQPRTEDRRYKRYSPTHDDHVLTGLRRHTADDSTRSISPPSARSVRAPS